MLRLATDENLNGDILRGLLRRNSDIGVVRIQDAGLMGADDPRVLAWAASENRVLVTHDGRTVPSHAIQRINAGRQMSGVIIVPRTLSVGGVIEDLILMCECSLDSELNGIVLYLPL